MQDKLGRNWISIWFRPFIEEPLTEDDDYKLKPRTFSRWRTLLLFILSVAGLAISIFELCTSRSATSIAAVPLWALVNIWVLIVRPKTGSVIPAILSLSIIFCHATSIARASTHPWTSMSAWDITAITLALVSVLVIINMPLRDPLISRAEISPPFAPPSKELRSPEDNITLWQWMSVSWMAPLLSLGSKRQLNDEDIWHLPYEFQHTQLHAAFRLVTGTVVWRLIKANWIDLFILTILALIEMTAQLAGPMILQWLLQAMEYIDVRKRPAIIYAISLLALRLINSQSGVFSVWFGRRCYERSRGEMITMLHEKVLNRKIIDIKLKEVESDTNDGQDGHLENSLAHQDNDVNGRPDATETTNLLDGKVKPAAPKGVAGLFHRFASSIKAALPFRHKNGIPDAEQPASLGKILNLMRNDVYETAQRFWEYQDLIRKPIALIFSIILTWRLVGLSCLFGIAVVIVGQIFNVILARLMIRWEKIRRQATDHKLQQISQYVESIRHLRWYGWHMTMLDDVMSARQHELRLRVVTFLLAGLTRFVNALAGTILPVAVFWAYTSLLGGTLRIDIAFPALQLFSILQRNLQEIPRLITVLINASVAVGRIEHFMSEPDLVNSDIPGAEDQLRLINASFSWPGRDKTVIYDATVSFPPGLTIITGPVASGKSALLQALLGELDLTSGELYQHNSSVAYCSQTPWLQSMSIRENILFGDPHVPSRYKRVLEACALLPDLASFEHGDLSPIGENGIGLSGGQKARVALARALYRDAKYLLLDDPISALDQTTAEFIVKNCFGSDLLTDRSVLLVTHRTDLCEPFAVQVVKMSDGRLQAYKAQSLPSESINRLVEESVPQQGISKAQETDAIPDKFEDVEHRAENGVKFSVYWQYIKAGKLKWWVIVIISIILWRALEYGQSWFLKEWGEAYKTSKAMFALLVQTNAVPVHFNSTPLRRFFDKLPDPGINVIPWLQVLLYLVLIQSFFLILSDIFTIVVTYNAGKNMFRDVMLSISNATFRFYDVTPVGRLMNRITGDINTVDGAISSQLLDISWTLISWMGSILVIASIAPLFLIFSVVLTSLFVFFFLRFLPTSQSLRRLEMVSLSPLMSNFGALLHGLMTVRAFRVASQFQARAIAVTDAFQKMDHFYWSLQTWLTYRFDILSAISTFVLTLLAIYSGLTPGLTAFVLIAAQKFVNTTHALCKQYGQLQLDFVSVERVVELLHLEQENSGTLEPPASWPNPNGSIVFENVTVRYAPHFPPALKDINMTIPGGSSTAITGRTGSGKSTLALSILATIAPEKGRILIDGIDIAKVSKQALRSRITFLAQEPILFPGTLQTNLDPLSEHSDTECAGALERVGGDRFTWSLSTPVDAGGKNLSQGQRQLVGLARALLRQSSIIIMDEATASIDFETSKEVQRVLRTELSGSTVIGIAHRSSAVESCDFVVRLADGEIVDTGAPEVLGDSDPTSADQSD